MISTIHGPVILSGDGYLIIEAGGLGYKVKVPDRVILEISNNESPLLHTELIVRQDLLVLYGFLSFEEAELFRMLISVSHIGPQTGLAILNNLSAGEIFEAITTKKVDMLSRVPGLGKKGSERIILELSNKIGSLAILSQYEDLKPSPVQDAILALISLGYHQDEAERACKKVHSDYSTFSSSDLIRESLKILKIK
jgi:holliday junction DNA helicase RuvA